MTTGIMFGAAIQALIAELQTQLGLASAAIAADDDMEACRVLGRVKAAGEALTGLIGQTERERIQRRTEAAMTSLESRSENYSSLSYSPLPPSDSGTSAAAERPGTPSPQPGPGASE